MNITLLKGYPDRIGKRFAWAGTGNGPASYVNTGTGTTSGDVITGLPFQNYFDVVYGGMLSASGNFRAEAMPVAPGPRSAWKLRYFVVSTGAEVANAVSLAAEVFQIGGFGGVY